MQASATSMTATIAATSAMVSQPTVLDTAFQPEAVLQPEAILKSNEVPTASKREMTYTHEHFEHTRWDENLFTFLADEQLRLHRKKDKWHSNDNDDWLAEFEKLALLELRK